MLFSDQQMPFPDQQMPLKGFWQCNRKLLHQVLFNKIKFCLIKIVKPQLPLNITDFKRDKKQSEIHLHNDQPDNIIGLLTNRFCQPWFYVGNV